MSTGGSVTGDTGTEKEFILEVRVMEFIVLRLIKSEVLSPEVLVLEVLTLEVSVWFWNWR